MKIVALIAANVKRLKAVEISPKKPVVEITGKNGQGKTSILDSIWWALAGASNVQSAPINKDADTARITLDLGELVVRREFKREKDGSGYTTSITVENAEGLRLPSPQRLLDGLLGALSFDPLAFARMDAKAQFNELKRFVPGVDFGRLELEHRTDYDRRTEVNRRLKEARAAFERIYVPAGTPAEEINTSELMQEMERASRTNEAIARERAEMDARTRRIAELREQANELERRADVLRDEAKALEESAPPAPPTPVDLAALTAQIRAANETNRAVALRREKEAARRQVEELEAQSAGLTEKMRVREVEKRAAVAAAQMPVPGLDFGDGVVLLAGVPFEQASDAEKLRASVAIAMANNPKLRVIRIRDGSLLDSASMAVIEEMAADKDFQVWVERVDESGNVGFVIEDGEVIHAN